MYNSVDPDLGLYCLVRPVFLIFRISTVSASNRNPSKSLSSLLNNFGSALVFVIEILVLTLCVACVSFLWGRFCDVHR